MDEQRLKEILDYILPKAVPGTYTLGQGVADARIAKHYYDRMLDTNARLLKKYGSGAANGTDNYYHPLLQCQLAKISDEDRINGLVLGYGKEAFDIAKKVFIQGKNWNDVIADSQKDLQNNAYGSNIGYNNRNKSCWELLDDLRTENMRKENIR